MASNNGWGKYRPVDSATTPVPTGVTIDDTGYASIAQMVKVQGTRDYIAKPYAQAIRQANGMWQGEIHIIDSGKWEMFGTPQLNQHDVARLAHGIKHNSYNVVAVDAPEGITAASMDDAAVDAGKSVVTRADKKRERQEERWQARQDKLNAIAASRQAHNESLVPTVTLDPASIVAGLVDGTVAELAADD